MNDNEIQAPPDIWSQWLLDGRFGGDPDFRRYVLQEVQSYRERVLDNARLAPGMTLADIGTGDGLIAFGAIARIGPTMRAILADISPSLLQHTQRVARDLGIHGQCRFLNATAENLSGLPDCSVDVVSTRAALAYVPDKRAAFREFNRILKPGGRISLCEPIMQDDAFEASALTRLIQSQPDHPDLAYIRLLQRWKAAQYPWTEEQIWQTAITNFSERDLVRLAREAGFSEIHLELHIDYRTKSAPDQTQTIDARWKVFLVISPYPGCPSLGQILAEQFSAEERKFFEQIVRPKVESRTWSRSSIVAFLTAEKPA